MAHLGYYGEFTQRFEPLVAAHQAQRPAAQLVAISDGADWIAGWLAKQYPEATVILDFFHAAEKVGEYAGMIFTSSTSRSQWVDHQHQALREGQLDQVIEEVTNKASGRRASIREAAARLVGYLDRNRYRMKYPEYRAKGYCIGSGAIESAMSTVVQQRCKLVGQRWTNQVGAVLNVRCIFKSRKRAGLRAIINHRMGYAQAA